MTKRCPKCCLVKPLSEYHLRTGTQLPRSRCKICTNADNIARAAANPEKHNARSKAWRDANPEKHSATVLAYRLANPERVRNNHFRTTYKVEFDALWQAQSGLCASCGRPMQREGKDPDSVCIDHDRTCCAGGRACGKCVRGLIHRNCNLVLGYAKDDIEILRAAIAYLERWAARPAR